MILQEVNETLSPLDFSKGRDPSMTMGSAGPSDRMMPAPAEEPVRGASDLESLFHALSANEPGITLDLDDEQRSLLGNLLADYLG